MVTKATKTTQAPQRIGLVKLGAIGDVVNTLPFVNRLRAGFPSAEIEWIIGPGPHALLEGQRSVDRFLVFDARDRGRWLEFARELRSRRFDLVIDMQRILKSGLITRASGAPRRLGFDRARCKEASWLFTSERIAPNARPGTTLEQYLEFADHLGCPAQEWRWDLPYTPFPPPARGERRVVLNLGASKPANRWYPDAWTRLIQRLVGECGASVHLSGGREDRGLAQEVRALAAVALEDHVGTLSLKQSAGLFAGAHLFVGCDTGPLHMAVALGTPVLALFGAADPARTGPAGQLEHVVSEPAPCSPCRRRTCNVDGHPCMRLLTPELVFARASTLLLHSGTTLSTH